MRPLTALGHRWSLLPTVDRLLWQVERRTNNGFGRVSGPSGVVGYRGVGVSQTGSSICSLALMDRIFELTQYQLSHRHIHAYTHARLCTSILKI